METLTQFTLPAGTVIHVGGAPVYLAGATSVLSDGATINLIAKWLNRRTEAEIKAAGAQIAKELSEAERKADSRKFDPMDWPYSHGTPPRPVGTRTICGNCYRHDCACRRHPDIVAKLDRILKAVGVL